MRVIALPDLDFTCERCRDNGFQDSTVDRRHVVGYRLNQDLQDSSKDTGIMTLGSSTGATGKIAQFLLMPQY